MITKTIVKDYAIKKCRFLAMQELDDKMLVALIKKALGDKVDLVSLIEDEENLDNDKSETIFDLIELLNDRPEIRSIIEGFYQSKVKNPVEELIDKYVDNTLVSTLSRDFFISKYGAIHCARCDIDDAGLDLLDQKQIVQNTLNYMTDPNIKVIFEGQVEYKDLRARYDVLIKNDDGTFDLYEVKGTNSVCKHPTKNGITDYSIDTLIKLEYLYDIAFQYYVYSLAGINIKRLAFVTLNRDFKLNNLTYPPTGLDLDNLFVIKDTFNGKKEKVSLITYIKNQMYVGQMPRTKHPMFYLDSVYDIVEKLRLIKEEKDIKPKKCYLCKKGPMCPFINECFSDASSLNSIFSLTNWALYGGNYLNMIDIMDLGIDKISDISIDMINSKYDIFKSDKISYRNARTQIDYQLGVYNNKYVVSLPLIKSILEELEGVDYLIFFDFESFQYPIPLVENSSPWKQVVSQYSMHIVEKDYDLTKHDFNKGVGGKISHFEFIGNPDIDKFKNPSINLYHTLYEQLKSSGIDPYGNNYKVIVFNENFEKTRMQDYLEDYNNLDLDYILKFIENFRNNVFDLLDFFTTGSIYCRDFNGKGSLKIVQPTLTSDINVLNYYNNLNLPFDFKESLDYHKNNSYVFNGSICLDLYKALLIRSHMNESNDLISTKELLDQALAYCKIDSWGTVIIYDIIRNFYLGNIKLDATYR